ncbi:MAG: amino acid ABC transporter substrate-binding protein [Candidatus Bathyarchaeia archaeon]
MRTALTKLQAAIIAVIVVVAVVAGVAYYYSTLTPAATPTPATPTPKTPTPATPTPATPTPATPTPATPTPATPTPPKTPTPATPTPATPTPTPPSPGKEEILLGFSMPLSGAHAYNALMVTRGYEFAIEDINNAGGVYVKEFGRRLKIKYVYYDDESDPTKAKTNAERLITVDKVDFLLGPFATPICFAVATVAETYKVVHVTTGIGSIPCETNNYNWTFIPFHTELHNGMTILTFLNDALPGGGPYKIALWAEDTTLGAFYAQGISAAVEKFAAKFTVVLNEKYTPGQVSYSTMILKTKDANPDMVFGIPSATDAITLIRESKELGLSPKVLYFQRASEPPQFWSLLGADAQGVIGSFTGHPYLNIPKNLELTRKYQAKYGEVPGVNVPSGYAAVEVLTAAIEKAGTLDRNQVRETLCTLEVDTVVGKLKFAGPGHCDPLVRPGAYLEQIVYQWQNGKQEIVWPSAYATATFIYPRPSE